MQCALGTVGTTCALLFSALLLLRVMLQHQFKVTIMGYLATVEVQQFCGKIYALQFGFQGVSKTVCMERQ